MIWKTCIDCKERFPAYNGAARCVTCRQARIGRPVVTLNECQERRARRRFMDLLSTEDLTTAQRSKIAKAFKKTFTAPYFPKKEAKTNED